MENIKLFLRDKINISLLPSRYSSILDIEFSSAEQLSKIAKEKKVPTQKKDIVYKCDVCGKEFVNNLTKFRTLLKSKYSLGIIVCGDMKTSFECCKKKQGMINTYRQEHNCTPAKGRILSEEEKINSNIKRMNSKGFKDHLEKIKGKSFKEQFGEDNAKIIQQKIREKRLQQGDPRLGCKNTKESKELMSKKRKEFLNRKENKYISPINGELVIYNEWFSQTMKIIWMNKTKEERDYLKEKYVQRYISGKLLRSRKNSGYHTAWYNVGTELEGKKDEVYLSNYELYYYLQLDQQKIYYKTNRIIYIPYLSPKDNMIHYYVPDILIYKDKNLLEIESIIEVKPYEFVFNPKNRQSLYYRITQVKLEALTAYCKNNNIGMKIVTEVEMNLSYINHNKSMQIIKEVISDYHKNKKN